MLLISILQDSTVITTTHFPLSRLCIHIPFIQKLVIAL